LAGLLNIFVIIQIMMGMMRVGTMGGSQEFGRRGFGGRPFLF
jgi:hypothetical protein